jgi:hypothetical protein
LRWRGGKYHYLAKRCTLADIESACCSSAFAALTGISLQSTTHLLWIPSFVYCCHRHPPEELIVQSDHSDRKAETT